MRRSVATTILCVIPAVVAGSAFLAGCEDGPNQTYTPATGTLFNQGNIDAGVSDPVTVPIDGGYNSQSVLTICPPDLKRRRWAKMDTEPIIPPASFAGIDLRGGDTWPGLTIEQAEQAPDPNTLEGGNCQGAAGGSGTCGENSNDTCGNVAWGDNGEVNFSYDLGTHVIDQLDLSLGYLGTMTFTGPTTSDPGCGGALTYDPPMGHALSATPHQYSIQLGYPMLKDGKTFQLRWITNSPDIDELYDAITRTFDASAGTTWPGCQPKGCTGGGTCLYESNDGAGNGYFGVRPLATYMIFSATVPQPAASEPRFMYIDYAKFVPNSTLPMTLSLGMQGPYTPLTPGSPAPNCQQEVGQSWKDYLTNCIQTSTDAKTNTINFNKLTGGHAHNLEEITFNVVGVNEDFALSPGSLSNAPLPNGTNLGTYGVVTDTQIPLDGDLSTEWYFDVRAFGTPTNELTSAKKNELVGSALVVREYQRLAENELARQVGKLPSKPADCQFASAPYTGALVCTNAAGTKIACPAAATPVDAAHVCTGLEGMFIPSAGGVGVLYPTDPPGLGPYLDQVGYSSVSVLKPGDHFTTFQDNSNALFLPGYQAWDLGYFWDESLGWVTKVMGRGDINNLPPEARDRRFFFKWFGIAVIKYLRAYGDVTAAGKDPTDPTVLNPTVVSEEPLDLETLFFDNEFGAQFDKFEYIDLATIAGYAGNTTAPDPTKPYLSVPFDFEYGTDVKVANQRYTNWYKRMDREELALYQALSPVKTDPPGAHANFGVNLTNMYGSPVIAGLPGGYECAAAIWTGGAWTPDPENQFPTAAADCATAFSGGPPPNWLLDPNDPTGNTGLLDLNGQQASNEIAEGSLPAVAKSYHAATGPVHSLLWQYPAVFGGQTIFSQGHSAIQVCPAGAPGCNGDPAQTGVSKTSMALEAAQAVIPSFLNPWAACIQTKPGTKNTSGCDPTDPTFATPIYAFVPWLPSQPGVGFSIPANGSSNLEVQTAQLDFTGNLETYLVDYVPYADTAQTSCAYPAPGAMNGGCNKGFTCQGGACVASDNTIEIRAIEAHDFLGEVFPCQDPQTGDVLHVRM